MSDDSNGAREAEHVETVVVGAGQAGLSVGYHLERRGLPFGSSTPTSGWATPGGTRWDSLRLFTPARYNGLDGLPVPGGPPLVPDARTRWPTTWRPMRRGSSCRSDRRPGRQARAERQRFRPHGGRSALRGRQRRRGHVELAEPRRPAFAEELDPAVVQLHSGDYRNPSQLREGGTPRRGSRQLGSGDRARAGPPPADVALRAGTPATSRFASRAWRHGTGSQTSCLRGAFHRVLTVRTPMGRKVRCEGPESRHAARADQAEGSRRRRESSASPGSPAYGTGCRCSRTVASSRSPTSSGARASIPTLMDRPPRARGAGAPARARHRAATSRGCSSSASPSSTRRRRPCCTASAGTRGGSRQPSPRVLAETGPGSFDGRRYADAMETVAKAMLVGAAVLAVTGGALLLASRLGWSGRLPGTVVLRGSNWAVYVPIGLSILLSVVLTIVLTIISRR